MTRAVSIEHYKQLATIYEDVKVKILRFPPFNTLQTNLTRLVDQTSSNTTLQAVFPYERHVSLYLIGVEARSLSTVLPCTLITGTQKK